MTQVIAYIDRDCAYLVADQRITLLDGSLVDEHRIKSVFYAAQVSFGFTGLAEFGGLQTDRWLMETLSSEVATELRSSCEHVAESATAALRKLTRVPRRYRHVTFLGCGWARTADGPIGIVIRISNRSLQGEVRSTFTADYEFAFPDRNPATLLRVEGQSLPAPDAEKLTCALRHNRRTRESGIDATAAAMVTAVRGTASANASVGQRVLSCAIPRAAIADSGDAFILVGVPSSEAFASFRLWEVGDWNGITYGPSVAWPGGALAGFKSGPVLPKLGGLTDKGSHGFAIGYPLAALKLADGGFACCSKADGGLALPVYATTSLLEEALDSRFRGSSPVIVGSLDDLADILNALTDPVEAVLVDPDPRTLNPAEVLTLHQINVRLEARRSDRRVVAEA